MSIGVLARLVAQVERVLKAALVKKTVRGTQQKREKNRRAHSAPGAVPKVQRKKKQVWSVQE